jgi:hypothetical protein
MDSSAKTIVVVPNAESQYIQVPEKTQRQKDCRCKKEKTQLAGTFEPIDLKRDWSVWDNISEYDKIPRPGKSALTRATAKAPRSPMVSSQHSRYEADPVILQT